MSESTVAICMILLGIICFIVGLYIGYRWHRSEIFPHHQIDEPNFRVIYIDPKIVRKMYGIPERKERR